MGRPRITGQVKKRKMYHRTAIAYKHKLDVLVYMDSGNNLDATIAHFYERGKSKYTSEKSSELLFSVHARAGEASIKTEKLR
ncbi:hypothetical protein V7S43_009919 [Phytophthora oleae]|uniref:Uncharacterized protein n=1 Tax=Phytophthora oleae TaxID=2107226 RepID=A0ABD3FHW1_9STRA